MKITNDKTYKRERGVEAATIMLALKKKTQMLLSNKTAQTYSYFFKVMMVSHKNAEHVWSHSSH